MSLQSRFQKVSSDALRQLQHTCIDQTLTARLEAWKDASGRRKPRHAQVQIREVVRDILTKSQDADEVFRSYVRKLMQADVFLLEVDCATAGELHDEMVEAIQYAPTEEFQGIFVVYNKCQVVRDAAVVSLELLLDRAEQILEVESITQNLNAVEGKQLAAPQYGTLKSILLDCKIQSDAMADMLLPHVQALTALCPENPHADIVATAVAYMVRDAHAGKGPERTLTTNILYSPSCDTVTSPHLREHLHGNRNVPGITAVGPELAARISACFHVAQDESISFGCTGLVEMARGMPASCVWAQTLLDVVHSSEKERTVISGVNTPTLILGQFLASTLQHHEDLGAGALNVLVAGRPKLWVSLADVAGYDNVLEAEGGVGSDGSRDKKRMRGFHSMPEVDPQHTSMFLQYSGLTVYTVAGHVWHQTLSLGTSIADSLNHWIGLEPTNPQRAAAVSCIAADLMALAAQPRCTGWAASYRSMAESYFPEWMSHATLAEQVLYVESVLALPAAPEAV